MMSEAEFRYTFERILSEEGPDRAKAWLFRQLREQMPQPQYRPPPEDYQQYLAPQPNLQKPNYRATPILAPPENLLIQFIGGPKNGDQEYFNWKAHPYLQNGAIFDLALPQPFQLGPDDTLEPGICEIARYKLTFIPPAETPFSDAQIVIGIFQ
jgi:hypothetical protein